MSPPWWQRSRASLRQRSRTVRWLRKHLLQPDTRTLSLTLSLTLARAIRADNVGAEMSCQAITTSNVNGRRNLLDSVGQAETTAPAPGCVLRSSNHLSQRARMGRDGWKAKQSMIGTINEKHPPRLGPCAHEESTVEQRLL